MWTPTHVQVTVVRAANLLYKGKNGVNDAFVTIGLGKERFQTSVKEKSTNPVQWNEECELSIPKQGNSAEIVLTALHRNFINDDFLGTVRIPLSDFDVSQSQSTFTRIYPLKNKLGKDNQKKRGELEVKTSFVFKPSAINVGSLSELSKKESHKSSFGHFVGGSLLSLGKEKRGLKKLAKAVGNKVATLPGRGKKEVKDDTFGTIPEQYSNFGLRQNRHEADPGVISDDEDDFRFDELSHKSSRSSLSVPQHGAMSTPKDGSLENLGGGEFMRKNYATPPPRTSRAPKPQTTEDPVGSFGRETNLTDAWDSKLFGRQQGQAFGENATPTLFSSPTVEPVAPSPAARVASQQPAITITPKLEETKSSQVGVVREPVPLSGQVQLVLKGESKLRSTSCEDLSRDVNDKRKKDKAKTSTLASFFSSTPKIKGSEDAVGGLSQKGSPVGVTNPIRQADSQSALVSRLPRETLQKFEGKSREELIELVIGLQAKLDEETEVNKEIRKYMDGVLARVIDTSPTILQIPYMGISGNRLSMKSSTWDF